ncbi:MAG: hypothetical protein VX404_05020 [Planctomycetota bacterium]|nr:hypothetical protein [Planctomycetota bacterium]
MSSAGLGLIVLGQGVELRRVLTLLDECEQHHLAGVVRWQRHDRVDTDPVEVDLGGGAQTEGSRFLGSSIDLPALIERYGKSLVLALGRPIDRWEALGLCRQAQAVLQGLSSTSAVIAPDTDVREGAVITQNCLVESAASVGVGSLLLPGARLGIGSRCGDAAVLDAGAALDDGARIADQVHLGAGSRVLEGRLVGQSALVLPGSIVTSDVEPGTIVSGCPAEVIQRSISVGGDSLDPTS